MGVKNDVFACVLDWLVKNKKVDGQKGLAQITGISTNTISRIMTGKTEPSDDTLRKLADKFGFNMQYLRGVDKEHMFESDSIEKPNQRQSPDVTEQSTLINELISSLKCELDTKDSQIATLQGALHDRDDHIETLKHRCAELRRIIDAHHFGLDTLSFPHGVADAFNDTI